MQLQLRITFKTRTAQATEEATVCISSKPGGKIKFCWSNALDVINHLGLVCKELIRKIGLSVSNIMTTNAFSTSTNVGSNLEFPFGEKIGCY